MGIELTQNAIVELQRIIRENALAGKNVVRLQVKGGGCAGFNYHLDFQPEDRIRQGDRVSEFEGFKLAVDMKSYLYLNGMRVDFKDTYTARQFVFENPNAKSTCGCGTSFSV